MRIVQMFAYVDQTSSPNTKSVQEGLLVEMSQEEYMLACHAVIEDKNRKKVCLKP